MHVIIKNRSINSIVNSMPVSCLLSMLFEILACFWGFAFSSSFGRVILVWFSQVMSCVLFCDNIGLVVFSCDVGRVGDVPVYYLVCEEILMMRVM